MGMDDHSLSVSPYYRPGKNELPDIRRRLTEEEVLHLQWKRIMRSPPQNVWSFIYGNHILSGAASISSVFLLLKMRRGFKLGGKGLLWALLPTIGLSYMPNHIMSNLGATYDILKGQFNNCMECAQVRGAGCQLLSGLFYPMIITPIVTYSALQKYKTVPAPPFYPAKEFRTNFARCFLRPVTPILAVSAVAQTALAVYIFRRQYESFVWLMNQDDALVHTR